MRTYPRTRFEIINNTSVQEIDTNTVGGDVALFMQAAATDKGPEKWELINTISDFTNRFGGLNFDSYGQAQFTVANLVSNGGYVWFKRLVSKDAKLANVTVKARVVQVDNVSYVYLHGTSAEGVKSLEEAATAGYGNFAGKSSTMVETTYTDPDTGNNITSKSIEIPLFTVTAVGRGNSSLTFRIIPEYFASKSSRFMKYTFEVSEDSSVIDGESIMFSFNPDAVIDEVLQSMNNKINGVSGQVKCKLFDDGIYVLLNTLAKTAVKSVQETVTNPITGKSELQIVSKPIPVYELVNLDYISGLDKKENPIGGIVTEYIAVNSGSDTESLWNSFKPSDINTTFTIDVATGIALTNGTDGSLGNIPMENPKEYEKLLLEAYGGNVSNDTVAYSNYDPIIYDLDRYQIDAILDCNFPTSVKNAIIDLADFRGDLVFLADLNLDANDEDEVIDRSTNITKSSFVSIYHNSFEIVDQFTKKQIKVTLPYLLGPKFISHIETGAGKPFAGMANNLTFPEIIEGTLNFMPVTTPSTDQCQTMVDNCINYIKYYNSVPVLDTMFVNDEKYTQMSFLHNILAVQQLIKLIRVRCPRTRYTFLDGDDLEQYLTDAESLINQYRTQFKSISMKYMADPKYESNNIFYAVLKVQFHNFVNEEFFKVIAIN